MHITKCILLQSVTEGYLVIEGYLIAKYGNSILQAFLTYFVLQSAAK